ncbi:hypothetical protein I553_3945, partial [Mycobacterium xenopi 4042]
NAMSFRPVAYLGLLVPFALRRSRTAMYSTTPTTITAGKTPARQQEP